VDADNRLTKPSVAVLEFVEERDGAGIFAADIPLSSSGAFGYTVRALPTNPLLANPAELGLVAVAH
jgi:starch phosphorylase